MALHSLLSIISLWRCWGIPVTAGKAEGICGDIQCATGYIVTRDGPGLGSPTDEMSEGKLLKEMKVPSWLNCITEVSGSFKAHEEGPQSPEHRYRSGRLLH